MQQILKNLSWGALVFTPAWLIRNGFLISLLLWLGLGFLLPYGSVLISVLFFMFGNKWSWGNGSRWESIERFLDSQYAWNYAAKLFLLGLITLGFIEFIFRR